MLVLGAEDLLTLQEALTSLAVPAAAYYATYLVLGIAIAWQFRRRPWTDVTVAFAAGAAMLGLSLVWDALGRGSILVEDGAKLVGVILWCLVPLWTLEDRLRPPRVTPRPPPRASRGARA